MTALSRLLANGGLNYFDVVYIDGSHSASDVLTDAVLAFHLTRVAGVMIFDDYLWYQEGPEQRNPLTAPKIAIDAFLNIFQRKVDILRQPLYQVYARKIAD